MTTLPNIIPSQSIYLGKADANGNVTIDMTWYLLLYNIATQVLTPASGVVSVSSTDLLVIGGEDTTAAGVDEAQVGAKLQALQALVADFTDAPLPQNIVFLAAVQTLSNKRNISRVYPYAAPGATPTIDTDSYDEVNMTAVATPITNMSTNLSGTPVIGDWLVLCFTDNGTAQGITWGAKFESSGNVTLPSTTVISTKLTVVFEWNTATSKWRCNGYA